MNSGISLLGNQRAARLVQQGAAVHESACLLQKLGQQMLVWPNSHTDAGCQEFSPQNKLKQEFKSVEI